MIKSQQKNVAYKPYFFGGEISNLLMSAKGPWLYLEITKFYFTFYNPKPLFPNINAYAKLQENS